MAVYVDNARKRYRTMVMSHMMVDTLPELLAMADTCGLDLAWLQTPLKRPHFDICQQRKHVAIGAGAIAITARAMAHKFPKRRAR